MGKGGGSGAVWLAGQIIRKFERMHKSYFYFIELRKGLGGLELRMFLGFGEALCGSLQHSS